MADGLKNVCLPAALRGASRNRAATTASTTRVLAVESMTPRALPPAALVPRSREPRPVSSNGSPDGRPPGGCTEGAGGVTSGLDRGHAEVVLQVLLLQRGDGAVGLQRGKSLVDAGHQGVALGEQQAEVLAGGRELPDHHRVRYLARGDVLRGRRVGDERGDLLGVQRLLHGIEVVVDPGRARRLDLAVDEGQAGGADLVA